MSRSSTPVSSSSSSSFSSSSHTVQPLFPRYIPLRVPLTKHNLLLHRLQEHEHPRDWEYDPTVDDSRPSDIFSRGKPLSEVSSVRSPSIFTRRATRQKKYPMGYTWIEPRTKGRGRSRRRIPGRIEITYDELTHVHNSPLIAPQYFVDDPMPAYHYTNAWDGRHPNYPGYHDVFEARVSVFHRAFEGIPLVVPRDYEDRLDESFPVWPISTDPDSTVGDFADTNVVDAFLRDGLDRNVDWDVDYEGRIM
jgi:hypothetical protein